jgi:CBS domain-containing protein
VLAGSRLWRMSKTDWLRTFDEVLSTPDESHLIRATVVFDFRATSGGLTISPQLVARIRAAREHPDFMRLMARSAAGFQVALGFRGHLATGRDDAPKGKLDVKRGAIIPVVNLIRFHALASGVTTSSTLDRLEAIHGVGALDRSQADALREAFGLITRVRFEHHASLIAGGHPPDNLIDPDELPPIARNDLRDALQIVRRAQKQLGVWIPGGK